MRPRKAVDGRVSMVETEASECEGEGEGEGEGSEDSDGIYGAVDGLQAQMDAQARNSMLKLTRV